MVKLSKIDKKDDSLIFTGERYQPEIGGDVQLEHLHRYAMAKVLVQDKIVLDIACGEGYGSALLAETAKKVTGVDIELKAVEHARIKYQHKNLEFLEGECAHIPLEENSVDVVVSFETIEHHNQHTEMMEEIKRVLRPEGFLVISSPNKKEYSDIPAYDNPYHIKELYSEEFEALLKNYFKNIQNFRQRVIYASAVIAENADGEIKSFEAINGKAKSLPSFRSIYDIAIASNVTLPKVSHSLLEVDTAVVTAGHLKHITSLSNTLDSVISDRDSAHKTVGMVEGNFKSELVQKDLHITNLEASLEDVLADRDSVYQAKQSIEDHYNTELSEKTKHITELGASLEAVVSDRDSAYQAKQSIEDHYKTELSEKTKHITELGASLEAVVSDRDSAYQAKQSIEDNYKSELSQKEAHITELASSLDAVIADRNSVYQAKQTIENNFKSELSHKEAHITELVSSIEAVVLDRDSAYNAVSLLGEANADINWNLDEAKRYSQEIENELNAAKATFIWKIFGRFMGKTSGNTKGG